MKRTLMLNATMLSDMSVRLDLMDASTQRALEPAEPAALLTFTVHKVKATRTYYMSRSLPHTPPTHAVTLERAIADASAAVDGGEVTEQEVVRARCREHVKEYMRMTGWAPPKP